jgi:hypothetical protein
MTRRSASSKNDPADVATPTGLDGTGSRATIANGK